MTEDDIAQFQAGFLDILDMANDEPGLDESLRQLRGNEALTDYVRDSDRTMLVVAAMLVKKWGRRRFYD